MRLCNSLPHLAVSVVLGTLVLGACGGGGGGGGGSGGGSPPPSTVAPSGLSYASPQSATVGTAINLTPTVSGAPTNYSVSPALPAGLSLNTSTGAISGTPSSPSPQTAYTITATNSAGSTTFNLLIAVAGQTASGVFVDSVVSGLGYTSGSESGVTDATGTFTYEVGQPITFHVGGVVLGTTAGKATVTPLDLVANSDSSTLAVQNIVRFLMLMDSDGDSANGITISDALRERADDWPEVDFTADDLASELASIIPDTQVDGTLRALASAAAAQLHFEQSFRCMYSGYFRGTYDGEDNGFFAFTILPAGNMAGAAFSVPDTELIGLIFTPNVLQVQNNASFVAGLASTGSSFSGQFSGYDQVSGTWSEGTFSGSRYGGTASAAYKFLALLVPEGGGPALGSVLIEIDTQDVATVTHHVNFANNENAPDITVPLNGNTLIIENEAGTLNVGINKETVTMGGTWSNAMGAGGPLATTGCRLR
jgi:hypothetical protein